MISRNLILQTPFQFGSFPSKNIKLLHSVAVIVNIDVVRFVSFAVVAAASAAARR